MSFLIVHCACAGEPAEIGVSRARTLPPRSEASGQGTGTAPTVRALRLTLEQVRAGRLDPVVFNALLAVVPAFAPGSIVTISDGRRCVVTGWDPVRPCSPMVSVLPAQTKR